MEELRSSAALVIQRCWRRYINRAIFRFYRDLITFREGADAYRILRAINPAEAGLLDRASGIHLRFRLGGISFPPTIYYKIFTHAPLCDVGAYAPRDYTKERKKHIDKKPPSMTATTLTLGVTANNSGNHNSNGSSGGDSIFAYRRTENNDWRPVAEKLLRETTHTQAPSYIAGSATSASAKLFHPNKLVRREERERLRKQKRVLWMMKAYRQGLAQEREDVSEEDAATQLLVALENDDLGAFEETADDLLSWSANLDYDSYMQFWTHNATSFGSVPLPVDLGSEDLADISIADAEAARHKEMDLKTYVQQLALDKLGDFGES